MSASGLFLISNYARSPFLASLTMFWIVGAAFQPRITIAPAAQIAAAPMKGVGMQSKAAPTFTNGVMIIC
jgi:hypothetical protein